jgi:hypothetical protein
MIPTVALARKLTFFLKNPLTIRLSLRKYKVKTLHGRIIYS